MKLYDKIGVPPTESIPGIPWIAAHGPFIVLSIEEAKELWNTAMERRDRDTYAMNIGKDDYNTAPTFEEYLKEFGITI